MPPTDPLTSEKNSDPDSCNPRQHFDLPVFVHEEPHVPDLAREIRDSAFEYISKLNVRDGFEQFHDEFVRFLKSQDCAEWWCHNDYFMDEWFHHVCYQWNFSQDIDYNMELIDIVLPDAYKCVMEAMLTTDNPVFCPPEWFDLVKQCGRVTVWDVYRNYDYGIRDSLWVYISKCRNFQFVDIMHTALHDENLRNLLEQNAVIVNLNLS